MNSRRWWIVYFVLGVGLIQGIGPAAADTPVQAGGDAPSLDIPVPLTDLGTVLEGEPLSVVFKLKNSGKGSLHIRRVKAGCTCILADFPYEVPGGGHAQIRLTIDTLGIHGRKTFKNALYSDDPARPVVILKVKVDIDPLVTLTPNRCFFNGPAQGDLRREITIETRGRLPLKVTLDPHDLMERITAELTPVDKDKKYRLTVQNIAPAPVSYRGRLMLRTNYPGRERIIVPVFAHLPPPVAAYPRKLALTTGRCPKCNSAGRYSGHLILRAHDNVPFNILALGPARKDLDVITQPLIAGQAYRITAHYRTGDAPPPDYLEIRTDREGYEVVLVPVEVDGR